MVRCVSLHPFSQKVRTYIRIRAENKRWTIRLQCLILQEQMTLSQIQQRQITFAELLIILSNAHILHLPSEATRMLITLENVTADQVVKVLMWTWQRGFLTMKESSTADRVVKHLVLDKHLVLGMHFILGNMVLVKVSSDLGTSRVNGICIYHNQAFDNILLVAIPVMLRGRYMYILFPPDTPPALDTPPVLDRPPIQVTPLTLDIPPTQETLPILEPILNTLSTLNTPPTLDSPTTLSTPLKLDTPRRYMTAMIRVTLASTEL